MTTVLLTKESYDILLFIIMVILHQEFNQYASNFRAFFKKLLVGGINKWGEFVRVSEGPPPENVLNF